MPRRGSALTTSLARGLLALFGWRVEGTFPNVPRLVIIAAPHRTNWDFPLAMLALFALRLRMHWLGKHTLFRGPARVLFRWLGGIPVDRTAPGGVVGQVAERMRATPQFVLAIAPEGTRRRVARFKSGFFHIARAADVPILPVRVSYVDRSLTLLAPVVPGPDVEGGLRTIEALFDRGASRAGTGATPPGNPDTGSSGPGAMEPGALNRRAPE